MNVYSSVTKLRFVAVALAAFLAGAISSPLLASSALAPITLQPGQQITIVAADLPTPTTAPTVSPAIVGDAPTVAPTVGAPVAPTVAPTVRATVAPTVGAPVAPTVAPTVRATVAPTVGAPVAPPVAPTVGATVAPTVVPKPTTAPTATSPSSIYANVMPTTSLPGWNIIWDDDFNTWNSSNYFVYPLGWHDTSGHGAYTPSIISASGGNLNLAIQTANGVHEVAAFCPLLPGSVSGAGHNRGDLLGMRYSFRVRADPMAGYKGVPLLWPQSETWPRDGEVDVPESDFMSEPAAFVHHQGGTSSSDQDYFLSPSGTNWQAWHTYTVEWLPGVRVDMWVDGVQWVHDTTRVPNTPMHLVMQFETSTTGAVPSSSTAGQVQIAWLAAWSVAP
jgi:hypothetical protein